MTSKSVKVVIVASILVGLLSHQDGTSVTAEDRIYGDRPWLKQDLYLEEADEDAKKILKRLRKSEEIPSFVSVFYRTWFEDDQISGGWHGSSGDRNYWRNQSPVVYSVVPGMAKRDWATIGENEVVLTAVVRDSYMVTGAYTKNGVNILRDPRKRW